MVEGGNFTVCDNISANQIIGTVPASVPDGQDVTYRLTEDAGGLFEIDEEGRISLASGKRLSFTNINRHVITVEASNTIHTGTHRVNVAINVDTVPLLISTNYVFIYTNDVSVMLNNLGQPVESFTHSSNFPMGLDFANQNGQLSIQGSPRAVTLDESNQLASVPIDAVLHNGCGFSSFRAMIAVHPIYVSGDQSPDIVAETNAEASSNNSNYPGQLERADAISFASGGTGTFDDPVIIGVDKGDERIIQHINTSLIRTNFIRFVLDFREVRIPNFGLEGYDDRFHILVISKNSSHYNGLALCHLKEFSTAGIVVDGNPVSSIGAINVLFTAFNPIGECREISHGSFPFLFEFSGENVPVLDGLFDISF